MGKRRGEKRERKNRETHKDQPLKKCIKKKIWSSKRKGEKKTFQDTAQGVAGQGQEERVRERE